MINVEIQEPKPIRVNVLSTVAKSGGGSGTVESVNGKTGRVLLNAADVHALPDTTKIPDPYDDTKIKESLTALEQLMPEENPTVGKVLKVLSVNEDGTFVCEWADGGSGSSVDVQIDGKSIVQEGVANLKTSKVDYGIEINNNAFRIYGADDGNVRTRNGKYRPLVANEACINAILYYGLGDGKILTEKPLTEAGQVNAQKYIGIYPMSEEGYGYGR